MLPKCVVVFFSLLGSFVGFVGVRGGLCSGCEEAGCGTNFRGREVQATWTVGGTTLCMGVW